MAAIRTVLFMWHNQMSINVPKIVGNFALLLESGDRLLLESGDKILLE